MAILPKISKIKINNWIQVKLNLEHLHNQKGFFYQIYRGIVEKTFRHFFLKNSKKTIKFFLRFELSTFFFNLNFFYCL